MPSKPYQLLGLELPSVLQVTAVLTLGYSFPCFFLLTLPMLVREKKKKKKSQPPPSKPQPCDCFREEGLGFVALSGQRRKQEGTQGPWPLLPLALGPEDEQSQIPALLHQPF